MAEVKKYLKVNGAQSIIKVLEVDDVKVNGDIITKDGEKIEAKDISVVTVSNEGTATEEVSYITVNGTEYKLAGAGVSAISFKIVESIEEVTEPNIIYLIKKESSTAKNAYDEYVLIDGVPEKIGDTQVKAYDDTELRGRIETIEGKESEWDAKQDEISDLETIRSGAALGATALQTVPAEYATVTYVDAKAAEVEAKIPSLDNYATISYVDAKVADVESKIPSVPTVVSAFANDVGYLTEHQSLADYATITYVNDGLNAKQDTISDTNRLSADLIQNGTVNYVFTKENKEYLDTLTPVYANVAGEADEVLSNLEIGGKTFNILPSTDEVTEKSNLVCSSNLESSDITNATVHYEAASGKFEVESNINTKNFDIAKLYLSYEGTEYIYEADISDWKMSSPYGYLYFEGGDLFESLYLHSPDTSSEFNSGTVVSVSKAKTNPVILEKVEFIKNNAISWQAQEKELPEKPEEDGSYKLGLDIEGETVSYSWKVDGKEIPSTEDLDKISVLTYAPELEAVGDIIDSFETQTSTYSYSETIELSRTLTEYNEVILDIAVDNNYYIYTADPADIEVATPSNTLYFVNEEAADPIFKSIKLLTTSDNKSQARIKVELQSEGTWTNIDCKFIYKTDSITTWNTASENTMLDLSNFVESKFWINFDESMTVGDWFSDFEYIYINYRMRPVVYNWLKNRPNFIKLADKNGYILCFSKSIDEESYLEYRCINTAHSDENGDNDLYSMIIYFDLNNDDKTINNCNLYFDSIGDETCIASINDKFNYDTNSNIYAMQNRLMHLVYKYDEQHYGNNYSHNTFNFNYTADDGQTYVVPMKRVGKFNWNYNIFLTGIFQKQTSEEGKFDSYQLSLAFELDDYQAPVYTSGTLTTPGYYKVDILSDLCECKKLGGGDSLPDYSELSEDSNLIYKTAIDNSCELHSTFTSGRNTTSFITSKCYNIDELDTITISITYNDTEYEYTINASDLIASSPAYYYYLVQDGKKQDGTDDDNFTTIYFDTDSMSKDVWKGYIRAITKSNDACSIDAITFVTKDGLAWNELGRNLPDVPAEYKKYKLSVNHTSKTYYLNASWSSSGSTWSDFEYDIDLNDYYSVQVQIVKDSKKYNYRALLSDISNNKLTFNSTDPFRNVYITFHSDNSAYVFANTSEKAYLNSVSFFKEIDSDDVETSFIEDTYPETIPEDVGNYNLALDIQNSETFYDFTYYSSSGYTTNSFEIQSKLLSNYLNYHSVSIKVQYDGTEYTYTKPVSNFIVNGPERILYFVEESDDDERFNSLVLTINFQNAVITSIGKGKSYTIGSISFNPKPIYSWKEDKSDLPDIKKLEENLYLKYSTDIKKVVDFTYHTKTVDSELCTYTDTVTLDKAILDYSGIVLHVYNNGTDYVFSPESSNTNIYATSPDTTIYFVTKDDEHERLREVYIYIENSTLPRIKVYATTNNSSTCTFAITLKDNESVAWKELEAKKELPDTSSVETKSLLVCNTNVDKYDLESEMTSGTAYAYFTIDNAITEFDNLELHITYNDTIYTYTAKVSDVVQSSPNYYIYLVQGGQTISGDTDPNFAEIYFSVEMGGTGDAYIKARANDNTECIINYIRFYDDAELTWEAQEKELPSTEEVENISVLTYDPHTVVVGESIDDFNYIASTYGVSTSKDLDNAVTYYDDAELSISVDGKEYNYTADTADIEIASATNTLYFVKYADNDPIFGQIELRTNSDSKGNAYVIAFLQEEGALSDLHCNFCKDGGSKLYWETKKANEKELPSTSEVEEDSMLVYKVSTDEEFTVGGNTFDYITNIGSAKVYANSDENIITEDAEKVEVEITYGSSALAYTATVEDPTAATLYFITSDDNDETFESVYMSPLAATLSFVYTVPKSTVNIPNVDDCKVYDKAKLTWEAKEDTPVSPTTVTYDYITFINWDNEIVESGNNYHLTDVTKSETVANALLLGKPVILIKDSTYYKVTCVQLESNTKLYAICPIYSGIDTDGAVRDTKDIGFVLDVSSDFLTKVFFGNN